MLKDLDFILEEVENYWKNLNKVVACSEFDSESSVWSPVEDGWDRSKTRGEEIK